MNRRDAELLAKQMRGVVATQNGRLAGVVFAVFIVGVMAGGMLFAPQSGHRHGPSETAIAQHTQVAR